MWTTTVIMCACARMTRAKPHWEYITMLLDLHAQGMLERERVARSLSMSAEAVTRLLALPPKVLKRQTARIGKVLQCRQQCGRIKPPRLLPEEHQELCASSALRAAFPVCPVSGEMEFQPSGGEQEAAHARDQGPDIVVSLPDLTLTAATEAEQRRREAYAHGKKEPQIAWFLGRLASLMRFTRARGHQPGHPDVSPWCFAGDSDQRGDTGRGEETGEGWVAIDIGGGRGDLAINLVRAVPHLRMHMMDVHAPSLQAAQATAREHGDSVASRMTFAVQDVTAFFSSSSLLLHEQDKSKMVLLGLHVCGGLTDAILALARQHRVAFLCCPCCFLKHPHLRHLAHTSPATPPLLHASSSHPPTWPPGVEPSHVPEGGSASGHEDGAESGQEHDGRAHRRGTRCEWCAKLHGGRCHTRPRTAPMTPAQAAQLFQPPDVHVPQASAAAPAGGGGAVPVGPWPAHEWETRWNRLARLGELTPHHGPAFVHSVAAHRTAMHSLGVCRV